MAPIDLDETLIPLAEVRAEIVHLMKDGMVEMSLKEWIYLLRAVHAEMQKAEK